MKWEGGFASTFQQELFHQTREPTKNGFNKPFPLSENRQRHYESCTEDLYAKLDFSLQIPRQNDGTGHGSFDAASKKPPFWTAFDRFRGSQIVSEIDAKCTSCAVCRTWPGTVDFKAICGGLEPPLKLSSEDRPRHHRPGEADPDHGHTAEDLHELRNAENVWCILP